MDDIFYIYIILGFVVIGILLSARACRDGLYFCITHWRYSCFIFACLLAGLGVGTYGNGNHQKTVSTYMAVLTQPKEEKVLARIDHCKQFVHAKLENNNNYIDPRPPLSDVIKIGAQSYWDTCARTFGMNYWKYDISIDGENGGKVLCRAYHHATFRSGNVNSWCNTVFAPDQKA